MLLESLANFKHSYFLAKEEAAKAKKDSTDKATGKKK